MNIADRIIGVGAILASTAAEALGQLAFKRASHRKQPPVAEAGSGVGGRWGEPTGAPMPDGSALMSVAAIVAGNGQWMLLGGLGFVADAVLWSLALYHLDITVAHPIGSLVFVEVAVASRWALGEKISSRRWAGIGLILAGSVMVALN